MDRKELALASNFGKAPKELQEAVNVAAKLYDRQLKIQAQVAADNESLRIIAQDIDAANRLLRKLIGEWNPEVTP
jgi:hypothetical protein